MENTNSKIITVSFAIAAGLVALSVSLLVRSLAIAFAIVAKFSNLDFVRHGLPIVVGLVVFSALQFNPAVVGWSNQVVAEVKKIVWPSRKDTLGMAVAVVIMVAISSLIITTFDFFSGYLLSLLAK